jgi:hypothetical protein
MAEFATTSRDHLLFYWSLISWLLPLVVIDEEAVRGTLFNIEIIVDECLSLSTGIITSLFI